MSRPVADAAVRCRHARSTELAPADASFATLKLGCSENPCAAGLEICKQIKGCKFPILHRNQFSTNCVEALAE
jgi:hypothetical protein